jgi:hypothetical protein
MVSARTDLYTIRTSYDTLIGIVANMPEAKFAPAVELLRKHKMIKPDETYLESLNRIRDLVPADKDIDEILHELDTTAKNNLKDFISSLVSTKKGGRRRRTARRKQRGGVIELVLDFTGGMIIAAFVAGAVVVCRDPQGARDGIMNMHYDLMRVLISIDLLPMLPPLPQIPLDLSAPVAPFRTIRASPDYMEPVTFDQPITDGTPVICIQTDADKLARRRGSIYVWSPDTAHALRIVTNQAAIAAAPPGTVPPIYLPFQGLDIASRQPFTQKDVVKGIFQTSWWFGFGGKRVQRRRTRTRRRRA